VFYFLKKALLIVIDLRLEILAFAQFFQHFPFVFRKFFWSPDVDIHQHISFSMTLNMWKSFSAQAYHLTALSSRLNGNFSLTFYKVNFSSTTKCGIYKAHIKIGV